MFGPKEPTVKIGGEEVNFAGLVKRYNNLVNKYNNLLHHSKRRIGDRDYDADELADYYLKLRKQYEQLDKKYQDLSSRYQQLKEDFGSAAVQRNGGQRNREKAVTMPSSSFISEDNDEGTEPIADQSVASNDLVDRYYTLAMHSLSEYQQKLKQLQQQLDQLLVNSGETEFLKLVHLQVPAGDYRRMMNQRNAKLVSYVDSHPQNVLLVNDNKPLSRDDDERGIKYWRLFVSYYRDELEKLLQSNRQMRDSFKLALRHDKDRAMQIRDRKPSFLSDNSRLRLGTIDGGIKDREAWEKQLDNFQHHVGIFLQGMNGERRVRSVVGEQGNHVLASLNLPYSYDGGKPNSNQIDGIVVNRQGIFVLEIKNFSASELGINADGTVYGKWGKQFRRYEKMNIVKQGENHRQAVQLALANDPLTKRHLRYLVKNIHVLYVSANPGTNRRPGPKDKPEYHFVGMDGLVKTIQEADGNLRPEIVDQVCDALTNAQQEEKAYPVYLFPSDPDKVMEIAWKQLAVIQQLNKLKLDDIIAEKDGLLLSQLKNAGLKSCDGYVTHQRRKR